MPRWQLGSGKPVRKLDIHGKLLNEKVQSATLDKELRQ
jgi:hypothetical protein